MDSNDKRSNLSRNIIYAVKAIGFYVIFTATAFFSGEMLRITGAGRNWRGFWSEELFCSVNLFYSLLAFFTLSEIVLLSDNHLKILFSDYTNGGRKACSPSKKLIFILSRPNLWMDIAVLSVFSLYFSGKNVKVEVGLCRGKKLYDKRDAAAEKQANREMDRRMRDQSKYD